MTEKINFCQTVTGSINYNSLDVKLQERNLRTYYRSKLSAAKSFNHQLQLLVKMRVKEAYLFKVFLTTTIYHGNFNRVYASIK
jgi:hypothetical protein